MVLFSYFAKAGNSCSSATLLNTDSLINNYVVNLNDSVFWLKFNSDSATNILFFAPKNNIRINANCKFYSGSCNSPNLIYSFTLNNLDTVMPLYYSNYNDTTTYYIKLENNLTTSQVFDFSLQKQETFLAPQMPLPCSFNCSLLSNGFENGSMAGFNNGTITGPLNINGWSLNPQQGNYMYFCNQFSNQIDFSVSTAVCPLGEYCLTFNFANAFSPNDIFAVVPRFKIRRTTSLAGGGSIVTNSGFITVNSNLWQNFTAYYTAPINATNVTFEIIAPNYGNSNGGNPYGADLAYDNISLRTTKDSVIPVASVRTFEICPGESVDLTVDAFDINCCDLIPYWFTNNIFNGVGVGFSINVAPIVTTEYVFYPILENCVHPYCNPVDTLHFLVIVNNFEVNAGPDLNVCQNEAFNLGDNVVTNNVILPVSHYWSYNGNFYSNNLNPLIPANTLSVGEHTFILNYFSNGCLKKDTLIVNILPIPSIGFSQSIVTCLGQPFTLEVNTNEGTAFNWSYNNNQIVVTQVNTLELMSTTYGIGTHVFTVVVTSANGCTNSTNLSVSIVPLPVVNAGEDFTVCSPEIFDLNGTANSAAGILSAIWSYNSIDFSNDLISSGNNSSNYSLGANVFLLTVIDNLGCAANDNVSMNVINNLPSYTLDVSNLITTCGQIEVCLPANAMPGLLLWGANAVAANDINNSIAGVVNGNCITFALPSPHAGFYIEDFEYSTLGGGCINKAINEPYIHPCCDGLNQVSSYSDLIAQFGTNISNETINVTGTIDLDPSTALNIDNCNFLFNDNTGLNSTAANYINITNSYLVGCETLWDGINVDAKTGLAVENSQINDGDIAIDINGGTLDYPGNYVITRSTFKRNVTGIYLHDFNGNTTNASGMQTDYISFTCWGNNFIGNEPLLNNAAQSTNLVYLLNVKRDVEIGINGGQNPNHFQGGSNGIFSRTSHLNVLNNTFKLQTSRAIRFENTVAIADQIPLNAVRFICGDVGTYTGQTSFNNFEQMQNTAIRVTGHVYPTILNNNFVDGARGIDVRQITQWPIDISYNTISGFNNSVALTNNSVTNVNFSEERIVSNNSISNLFYPELINTTGISISEVSNPATNPSLYRVLDNKVFNFNTCVTITKCQNPRINFNEIRLSNVLGSANVNYGIRLQNNLRATVTTNTIGAYNNPNGNTNIPRYIGISNATSTNSNICGNQLTELNTPDFFIGSAIEFLGACAPVAELSNNIINNFRTGIYIASATTPIGIVGSATEPKGNEWHTMLAGGAHTTAGGGVNNTNELWCNQSLPFLPNPYIPFGSVAFLMGTLNTDFPTCNPFQRPANPESENYYQQVASNNTAIIGTVANRKWIAKEMLKINIDGDSSLIENVLLENFEDSVEQKNIGLAVSAMANIQYPISDAASIVISEKTDSIQGTLSSECLYKEMLQFIYQNPNLLESVFSDIEINRMREIANYCPFTKGNAVYLARAYLASIEQENNVYINSCEYPQDGNSSRTAAEEFESEEEFTIEPIDSKTKNNSFNIILFPNPASKILNIKLDGFQCNYSFSIYNSYGALLHSFNSAKQILEIDVNNFSEGVYFLKITDTKGKIISTNSFTVSKK